MDIVEDAESRQTPQTRHAQGTAWDARRPALASPHRSSVCLASQRTTVPSCASGVRYGAYGVYVRIIDYFPDVKQCFPAVADKRTQTVAALEYAYAALHALVNKGGASGK